MWLRFVAATLLVLELVSGSPLILTPYIEMGRIDEAQNISAVTGTPFDFEEIPSYSGYFTVNQEYNSNLFFWFFPAAGDFTEAPILLWLQGGPGFSLLFGLREVGPFYLDEDANIVYNPFSWHRTHSLIFIDNPVGTGFSFTDSEDGYATDQTQIGEELYSALVQFFILFPELQSLPFYIAGQSSGAKFACTLGHIIHSENPTAEIKINLQGLLAGGAFIDPPNQLVESSTFLYQMGLLDRRSRDETRLALEQVRTTVMEGNTTAAWVMYQQLYQSLVNKTGYSDLFNALSVAYLENVAREIFPAFKHQEISEALHVGQLSGFQKVYTALIPDYMRSVRHLLEELLDSGYRVLFYTGNLDLTVPYASSEEMYEKLEFGAMEEYRQAARAPWYVRGILAGYSKSAGNFTEVLVRNAGHMVPRDQPLWAFELVTKFTRNSFP